MTKIVYETPNHAQGRLLNTLIRYEGEPVIVSDVQGVEGKMELSAYISTTGREVEDKMEAFDLSPVPLGNVQVGDVFAYVTRSPRRRWKQGLDAGGMQVLQTPWGSGTPNLRSEALREAVMGVYKPFEEAYKEVYNAVLQATPFDRNFGVGRNDKGLIVLTHRGKEVGMVEDDIFLYKENFYLQEDLLRVLNK